MKRAMMALAGGALLASLPALAGGEAPAEPENELHRIAGEMASARGLLDAEHHDTTVQTVQGRIAEALDRLIRRLSAPPPSDPGGPCSPRANPGDPGNGSPRGERRPGSPLDGERLTDGPVRHGPKGEASDGAAGPKWWQLPPKVRAEIEGVGAERLPERYRRLLEFYWASVAEDKP